MPVLFPHHSKASMRTRTRRRVASDQYSNTSRVRCHQTDDFSKHICSGIKGSFVDTFEKKDDLMGRRRVERCKSQPAVRRTVHLSCCQIFIFFIWSAKTD